MLQYLCQDPLPSAGYQGRVEVKILNFVKLQKKPTFFEFKIQSRFRQIFVIILKSPLFHRTPHNGISLNTHSTQSDNKKRTILEMENSSSILSLPNGEKLRCTQYACPVKALHPKCTIIPSHTSMFCSPGGNFLCRDFLVFPQNTQIHCIHFIVQLQVNSSQSDERKGGVFEGWYVCACYN